MLLTITDENFPGTVAHQCQVAFETAEVTVEEIIKQRVTQEVESYNQQREKRAFLGLVAPKKLVSKPNDQGSFTATPIDAEQQVYIALDSFQKNGFFLLIDNIQAEELHQRITLREDTVITFLKLTPLIGG